MAMEARQLANELNKRLTEEGLKRIIAKSYKLGHIAGRPKYKRSPKAVKAGKKVAKRKEPRFSARVRKEIHILLCTNDKKYAPLRKGMQAIAKRRSQTAIVSGLSVVIAPYVGIATAALITPVVAMVLLGSLEVGINAWCAGK